ncbi:LRR receptor-like serine/threonine-protein kinase GSO1 [Selaginella moellendorffii]|uniref:LRR receptor-like serine/threonine-protein kinase GSO1 n=1 Tax=Selaginella moellendorffii TaxID=88036 RepID=UPI000D1C4F9D|nr:LRR receptor-like serine/threonine-protein kinase GSO1 [Selaginella moellendorffii]|eukprot:XP_024539075.1 LRR receptor-like serine/threonine-protein kinase GSO1 [Selaginella moellendorffii]
MKHSLVLLAMVAAAATSIFARLSCVEDEEERASLTAISDAASLGPPLFCCQWVRIFCSVSSQGRIKSLDIIVSPGFFPEARILRQVCSFTKLRRLRLTKYDDRDWDDEIPSCLEELSELKELKIVGSTDVSFKVPIIPRLKNLVLEGVHLTEAIFHSIFSSLKELQYLTIQSNSLSNTTIPASLCSLSSLVHLDLSSNQHRGEIPPCLPFLSRLQELRLSDNLLQGSIPYLGNFSQMQQLVLDFNQLSGPFPASLCNITATIVTLDLSMNRLSSLLPDCVSGIQNLFLRYNQLTGPLPPTLFAHNSSHTIELSWNQFTGPLPEIGDAMPEGVMISNNFLSGSLSSPKWHSFCHNMRFLDLSNNQFTGSIPKAFGNCTRMARLSIDNNELSGEIPSTLGALSMMVEFTSRDNQLVGRVPSSLGNCSYLMVLDLASNSLSGELGEWIYQLKFLNVLSIGSNNFVGDIPVEFGNFSSQLMAIDLSENRFSGTLPAQFSFPTTEQGPLAGLQYVVNLRFYSTLRERKRLYTSIRFGAAYLDMSGNSFQGSIPDSLGNFSRLSYLDLSRNQFVGQVPHTLGSLHLLQALDLSSNRLSGSIPRELTEIPQMSYFNVSYNNLTGAVPQGAQFNTFTEDSYISNPGLCDFPLSPCDPKTHSYINSTELRNPAKGAHLDTVIIFLTSISLCSLAFMALLIYYPCSRTKEESDEKIQTMSIIEGEIWSATRGFNKDNIVDKGGCSTIYRGVLRDGQTVAVKVYKHSDHTGEEQFIAEYNSLKDLRHRNIVRIIEWCSESKLKALVFKFMDNGSLEKQLHELHGSNLPWTVRMNVVQGVANALSYLHEEAASTGPIIHRDIKPANIFLDQNMEAHLGDFGIATNLRLESSMHWESKLKGSIGYVAPGTL